MEAINEDNNKAQCAEGVAPKVVGDDPRPWVVITNHGQAGETVSEGFSYYLDAIAFLTEAGMDSSEDIIKCVFRRLDDGTLINNYQFLALK